MIHFLTLLCTDIALASVTVVDSQTFHASQCKYTKNWYTYATEQTVHDMSHTATELRRNTVVDYSYMTSAPLLEAYHLIDVFPVSDGETASEAYDRICNDLEILSDPVTLLGDGSSFSAAGRSALPINSTHVKLDFYVRYDTPGKYVSVCTLNAFQAVFGYCGLATNVTDAEDPQECTERFKQCLTVSDGCPLPWMMLLDDYLRTELSDEEIQSYSITDFIRFSHCTVNNHKMVVDVMDLDCGERNIQDWMKVVIVVGAVLGALTLWSLAIMTRNRSLSV